MIKSRGVSNMSVSYARQTLDAPNPLRRYSHRNRLKRSLSLALPMASGTILDYGCGSGVFIQASLSANVPAVGYEPFMREQVSDVLPIYSDWSDVERLKPYGLVTIFETIEHLSIGELDTFLDSCQAILSLEGKILISVPIEIGPALFLKHVSRGIVSGMRDFYSVNALYSLLSAAILGIPEKRTADLKLSHKGFDFRAMLRHINSKSWATQILCYGPLPIGTWYGNSQVFILASRQR